MWILMWTLFAVDPGINSEPTAEQIRFFETSIRPVLVEHCLKCHGPDKQWANLRLDTREGLLKGGESGDVVVLGRPDKSRFIDGIRQTDPDFKMPPEGKLTDRQIADFERWIEMGAPYPKVDVASNQRTRDPNHWAFQPVIAHAVPQVQGSDRSQTVIDQFILHKLESQGLASAQRADSLVLIRRITFDLLGLPPTPEEIVDFASDASPDAVERLVDRLLASPQYGERWGRHWLDVARYADSNGLDENVAHGNAWRYRDYVVAAFNRDLPYDQLLREQLAGDLLPAEDEAQRREQLIATGFLSIGPKVLAEVDEAKMRMDIVDEQIESVGKAVLGMTLGCARCHDHKFDPVSTADYYGLAGVFKSTRTMETYQKVARWHESVLPSEEARTQQGAFDQQLLERQQSVDRFLAEAMESLKQKSVEQASSENPEAHFPEETQKNLKQRRDDLEAFKKAGPDLPAAMAVTEDQVVDVAIHIRGNPLKLGEIVSRHVPSVMRGVDSPAFASSQSGRQELAAWLTNPRHPLTSRVIVNRIWRWHFGRGIVSSADNFGLLGNKPSHPELLDWLAARFVADGWSFKRMHRLILSSATYQQGSKASAEQLAQDSENQWLSRANVRRLEAEEVRDALLAFSGQLDTTMGGSLLNVKNRAYFFDHTSIDKTDYSSRRRAIYLPIVRNNVYDVFQLMDFPDPAVPTGDRPTTTVASQALLMMNSELVMQAAGDLAQRLAADADLPKQKLSQLFLRAYAREATDDELKSNLKFLSEAEKTLSGPDAWSVLCHVMIAANEFIYVR